MNKAGDRPWLRWLERAAALAVLAFLTAYLIGNWRRVAEYDWTLDLPRLLASVALHVLVYSGMVLLWRHVLIRMGGRLSGVDAHRVWYLSNLGRYVPGKVMQLAGLAYMVRAKGMSALLGIGSALVAQAFVLGTAALVAALALPEAANGGALYVAGAIAAVAILLALLTPLFDGALHLALRATGREPVVPRVPWSERVALAAGYTALWLTMGFAFWLFLTSVTRVEPDAVWALIGIHAAGYVAGYLAFFVPGGLGVREGVYALFLGLYIPPGVAVAAAILVRVWSTLAELLVAGALLVRWGTADLRAGLVPSRETDP